MTVAYCMTCQGTGECIACATAGDGPFIAPDVQAACDECRGDRRCGLCGGTGYDPADVQQAIICAWCETLLRAGQGLIHESICGDCFDAVVDVADMEDEYGHR